jgi:hypothetical protein
MEYGVWNYRRLELWNFGSYGFMELWILEASNGLID